MLGEVLGSAGELVGSIIGEIWASGDDAEVERLNREMQSLIDNLDIPSVEKQRVKLQLAEFAELGPSAMSKVKVDPMFEGIQREALASFQKTAQGVGTDKQARAAQYQGMRAAGQTQAARQGAIRQSMQARGMGGSGMELAQRLAASQQEADQSAMLGYQAAADSEARRAQAQAQAAGLAGQMGDTSFSRQQAMAAAADRVAAQNAAARNQANQYNTRISNQQEMYNKQLIGENYQRQLEKARLQAGARGQQADYWQQRANRKRGIAGDAGGLVGTGIGTIFGG